MWETFISWYLNNYLGNYVENLNSQQLSLALSTGKGELELENVPLKKNIFRGWGLPIQVKSGVVGRIKIELNLFKYLRNEPVLISIEDVCLVAEPISLSELDPLEEEAMVHEAKMSALDSHEGRWKAQFDLQANSGSYYSSLYVSSTRIGASIATKILENLQLTVNNVHIRFEYENEKTHRLVAFGIVLQSLQVQSCDPNWNPLSSTSTNLTDNSFKTFKMNKLGVYCDTKAERLSNLPLDELKVAMAKQLSSQVYLLSPVTVEARVTKNNSVHPLNSMNTPRFDVHLTLEKVPMQLSDSQYKHSYRTYKYLRKLNRNCRLRHYRPFASIKKETVREWWVYATHAVLSLRGFRRRKTLRTWEEVLARVKDNCEYVIAYQQHLTEEILSTEARKLKDRMEAELHFDDIVALRKVAMKRIEQISNSHPHRPRSSLARHSRESSVLKEEVQSPETETSSVSSSSQPNEDTKPNGAGLLSWFFPSWSSQNAVETEEQSVLNTSDSLNATSSSPTLAERSISETDFEEAILGEVKAFGRDALLARFNFTLNHGSVLLLKQRGPFLDLSFGGVGVDLLLKPRSGSHKFNMRLSTFMLKDTTTKSTILSPHSSLSPYAKATDISPEMPLFNLAYEMKPHKKAGHRLTISTKPMDLTFYPSTWDQVGKFFSVDVEDDCLEIPYNGYEAMKQKTKEELQVYWERLVHSRLSDDSTDRSSAWEIYLDIFAPQITVYGYEDKLPMSRSVSTAQNVKRSNSDGHHQGFRPTRLSSHQSYPAQFKTSQQCAVAVIIDLGRFKFTNVEYEENLQSHPMDDKTETIPSDDDEEDEFVTPCTSPAPEMDSQSPEPSIVDAADSAFMAQKSFESFSGSLEEIQAKFYKKYSLEIIDVQVIVVDGNTTKEALWKATSAKGSSFLHFIDKFSIDLQLERRLVYSEDPLWPALTLVGSLPKLTFHLNENKMLTLRSVFSAFSSKSPPLRKDSLDLSLHSSSYTSILEAEKTETNINEILTGSKRSGKLFLAEFTIHHASVDLQAGGRNIAELQVMGTKTVLTHREEDSEFSFIIQSLLLADAVQTFGADFELLLASHKHVCMDTVSGSLKDSEPTSPVSPVSPSSPMPPASLKSCSSSNEIPLQFHDALVSSLRSKKRTFLGIPPHERDLNSDALINIDIILTSKDEDMAIVNVLFNNLDVIANQETIMEIVKFFSTVFPSNLPNTVQEKTSDANLVPSESSRRVQASFEFHRLNVLLLRGVIGRNGQEVARKIATATISNARVNCTFQNSALNLDGSLGGLQVLNLTREGYHHQRVLSVGQDPLVDTSYVPFSGDSDTQFLLQPAANESALTFHYEKSGTDNCSAVSMRMASVVYTHCPLFLFDLKKCISQFQTPLATSLRSAATQIALGLVRQDTVGNHRSPFGSFGSLEHLDFDAGPEKPSFEPVREGRTRINVDIVLDSPIVVLPRSRDSPEVLVAHLGQITIMEITSNSTKIFESHGMDPLYSSMSTPSDKGCEGSIRYNVFIRDVSLYSLNLRQRWQMMENFKLTNPNTNIATLMRSQDLYRCDAPSAVPILHNTVLQFQLSYAEEIPTSADPGLELNDEDDVTYMNAFHLNVQGQVINSLKVSLTPQQYSQLFDSIGNIAPETDHLDEIDVEARRLNWEKQKLSFRATSSSSAPLLPSPSRSSEVGLIISSCFEVPDFIVELVLPDNAPPYRPRLFVGPVPNLSMSCSDLLFKCDRKGFVTEMNISLKALKLEDLNVDPTSWKRVLAISKTENDEDGTGTLRRSYHNHHDSYSTSCPDLRQQSSPISSDDSVSADFLNIQTVDSSSLPGELGPQAFFEGRVSQTRPQSLSVKSKRKPYYTKQPTLGAQYQAFCPVTPPPSPRPKEVSRGNLVQINIVMVDPKSPKFVAEYGGNHKQTSVDFNSLELLLTVETFLCLRRFFADAAASSFPSGTERSFQESHSKSSSSSTLNQDPVMPFPSRQLTATSIPEEKNTETLIKVRTLRIKLANSRGHLAEAEVSEVSCELRARGQECFGVVGHLGSLEIRDISCYAGLYPVKFAFQGEQALDFDYARQGMDGKFRLTMSSIVVVHTNRFYTEFTALWNALFAQLPASVSPYQKTLDKESTEITQGQSTRVMLDIQAGAPVILLPYSSASDRVLVADLGHLSVRNKFLDARDLPGIVINCITIDLIEMDLYSGELKQVSQNTKRAQKQWDLRRGWAIVKTEDSLAFLQQQCQMNLKVKRIFEGTLGESSPTTRIQGMLSTVHCTIDSEKYKLIRGLLSHNIGENIGLLEDLHPLVLLNSFNEGQRLGKSAASNAEPKVDLNFELDLVNVTLEVLKQPGEKLGRVDFIKSKFTFQMNSNGSKDVDLASQEILISDARFEDKNKQVPAESVNVFTNILQQSIVHPASTAAHCSTQTSFLRSENPLQAEIHYRMTQRGSSLTIVLNNVRLMVILDWWMEVRGFLFQDIPLPPGVGVDTLDNKFDRLKNVSPLLERSRGLSNPVTVSAGIVTKRAPVLDVPESTFELKINISNCELVVVEKTSVWDTNALILKASAAFGFRPHLERPVSCNILQCELFSCILGLESETALSILDPTNVQFDIVRHSEQESKGILDATMSLATSGKVLKIQSPSLNLRLSYYDMKMFIRLMDKFSKEAQLHFQNSNTPTELSAPASPTHSEPEQYSPHASYQIDQIVLMGFSREEAIQSLEETQGCLEDAILMLTKTSSISDKERRQYRSPRGSSSLSGKSVRSAASISSVEAKSGSDGPTIHGVEVRCNYFSVCVIDDCRDSDIPVIEISVQQLELFQNRIDNFTVADCLLSGDYYNRALSGWEPFLEPWKCSVTWKRNQIGELGEYSPSREFPSRAPEFEVTVSSRNVMEINVTSTFLSLYKTVSSNWTEDYQQQKGDKRRTPFIPFALKNETGSKLWFCTIISNNEEVFRQQQKGLASVSSDTTGWIEVSHGSTQSFSFEGRGKLRHRTTHQLKIHQLAVRVDGWNEITPVSVDRVGTYFRMAKPETTSRRYGGYVDLPPTRLVLDVSLHGSAQKIVTVRSALMLRNALSETVELKLENTIVYPSFERAQTGGSMVVQIRPGQTYPVPLHSVWAHLWIRPVIPDDYPLTYLYCTKALLVGNSQEGVRECLPRSPEEDIPPYMFCVAVKRNEFPADDDELIPRNSVASIVQLISMTNRANLITLLSPFKLVNLLPHEISYEIKSHNIRGRIAPGKWDCKTNIETCEAVDISFQVDNFPQGATVSIDPASNATKVQRIKIQDTLKRILTLTVKVLKEEGGVLAIQLVCPCWIVNKSGLPLVCKQEAIAEEAAGQFEEHEVGRMVTPLMMSFTDQEGYTESLAFRVGNGLHKDSVPYWCRSFLCQTSTRVRKLIVSHSNNSPESVYMVGVEIKSGTGRYKDTKLVVIYPRFIVDNRSSYKIEISQRVYATSFFDAKAQKTHLSLPTGCNLPFHWPRLDKEQLLCVRLKDVAGSSWSGGFPIDNVDSFHINVRDADSKCYLLRVEIVVQGPTFFVVFSDTTQLPPPFRIDNFSLVPLVFHQACLAEERLKITGRPETSVPYALDEPTQPAHLTVAAPGGTSVMVNMDDLRYLSQLTYENFFYIGFSATFPVDDGRAIGKSGMESLELVLDVEGAKVVLSRKEYGKRSQLWRVSADGLIEHEGSSPPRDKKSAPERSMLVLDIAGPAPLPAQCVPLMLRKPDRRRMATQHWEFTVDGRLKLRMYENLYVQAKDGFGTFGNNGSENSEAGSWQPWSEVVLGPSQPVCYIRTDSGIPAEQAVSRQKLRPGSGILSLTVGTDGPTRVLRITDVEHPPRHQLFQHTFEEDDYNVTPTFRIKVELPAGFGVSLISCTPREELVYGRFVGFALEWTESKNCQILRTAVLNFQIDNQLLECEKTASMYVASSGRSETVEDLYQHQPAIHLYWECMKSNLNAKVYRIWELIMKPINLIIEERLLLKLSMWLGFGQKIQSLDMLQQSDFEVQKALTSTTSVNTRRYYFGVLKLILHQVKLSVLTSSKLSPELAALKRRLGLTLIRFEDANVDLDPFEKHHPFETFEFLWALIIKHYRDELLSQAAVILGSTDFLGNPLGFVNDFSEGVSLMIYEGSVGALVKNVAHGLSNSAAKFTGTLGEGLGKTILDDRHEEERRKIKEEYAGSSGEHFYAGLKGFGHGLMGGVTSVVSQTYEAYSTSGSLWGILPGIAKGAVGTITKPAVGVLDFATGAASAIRDSSKTSSRMIPVRLRPTRVVLGNGGLLPVYSEQAARGQELLYDLNDKTFSEIYIACETLKTGANEDLRVMISSVAITVFKATKGNPTILRIPLRELVQCQIAPSISERERTPYIEFLRIIPESQAPCRPQVICENEQVAKRVVQQVNYAKVLFEEMRHSQIENISQSDE